MHSIPIRCCWLVQAEPQPLLLQAARGARYLLPDPGTRALSDLLAEFEPDVVAVEQVFFQVNVRTAMATGQASGLALAEAAIAGCEVIQYTPNQVKDAVAGWGGADKEQVQKMVQARLKLSTLPKPADAADAAAIALTHLSMSPIGRQLRQVAAR